MNTLTRVTKFGVPAIVGIGFAWIGNRIIRNENKLKDREIELKLQLNCKRLTF